MYSRQEASKLRHEFWTAFGQYMLPVLSSEGEKVNWINYRTGEKDISFRMNADSKKAEIGIEISHKDPVLRQIYFEQFVQFRQLLETSVGGEWNWQLHATGDHEKPVSRIFTELQGVSIFKKEDWPALISFFKPRLIGLDEFWNEVKFGFEMLR